MSAKKCKNCGEVVLPYTDKTTGGKKCPKCEAYIELPIPVDPDDPITCPKCGSAQLTANKKGFGLGKAVVGGVLISAPGLLAGFIGSGKIKITCLKCGYAWKAGKA